MNLDDGVTEMVLEEWCSDVILDCTELECGARRLCSATCLNPNRKPCAIWF